MLRDKEKVIQAIEQSESYVSQHTDLLAMTVDELSEHFESTEFERGMNWSVIALVVANSLTTTKCEKLITELCSLEVRPLTQEYIGYILYSKYNVNLENILLTSDKMGCFKEILPYILSNIVFQTEFQEENILKMALLINSHLREDTSVHSLLLNYATHIINFSKETVVFDSLTDVDFEFKNDILSTSNRSWYKKSKNDAAQRLEESFQSNREEKIKTALCIIKESYDQEIVERFYDYITRAGESISTLRGIIVSIYTTYLLSSKKENEIYTPILRELKIYSQDNQNKNDFLMAIQYKDKMIADFIDIFENIVSAPLPNDESFRMVDTIIHNHFKDRGYQFVLDTLSIIYSRNRFNYDFDRFTDAFSLSVGILPDNDINVWEYIWTEFDKDHSSRTAFYMGILLDKFSINVGFTEVVTRNKKSISLNQTCGVLELLQYVSPIGDKVCRLYFDLAPFRLNDLEKYIQWGINELYSSFPITLTKIANERQDSNNNEIKSVSDAIIEHDKNKHLDRDAFYKVKDFQPSNEREKTIRKVLAEQNQKIKKLSEEKSIFAMLCKTAHLKYGKRMGFITYFGNNSEYSSRTPVALTYECEPSKKYLIDPVRYTIDRISALNEVTEDEADN